MDELVDFEALIDLNEVLGSMEKVGKEIDNISQTSLIDALDKMCEAEDKNNDDEVTTNAEKPTVEETIDDVINMDNFEDIFSEMRMSVDKLEKLEQKEFSIDDLNTEPLKDKNIVSVNMRMTVDTLAKLEQKEFNITDLVSLEYSQEKIMKPEAEKDISETTQSQNTHEIPADDTTIDLDEFERILNKIRDTNDEKEKKENTILNDTKIQNAPLPSDTVIDLDEISDTGNDDTIKDNENKTAIENPKQNDTGCEPKPSEHKVVETSELQKTGSDLIIDLDTTDSETECDNLNNVKITKEANIPPVVEFKETDIISLSSDSEDDGYNSADFEFIDESEAKKNNLIRTSLQTFTYYNADYMKYRKSINRVLPCGVSSSKTSRESHVVPQGEAYLDLFRGMYAPAVMNNLYHASKKRVLPVSSMTLQDGHELDVYRNKGEENEEVSALDPTTPLQENITPATSPSDELLEPKLSSLTTKPLASDDQLSTSDRLAETVEPEANVSSVIMEEPEVFDSSSSSEKPRENDTTITLEEPQVELSSIASEPLLSDVLLPDNSSSLDFGSVSEQPLSNITSLNSEQSLANISSVDSSQTLADNYSPGSREPAANAFSLAEEGIANGSLDEERVANDSSLAYDNVAVSSLAEERVANSSSLSEEHVSNGSPKAKEREAYGSSLADESVANGALLAKERVANGASIGQEGIANDSLAEERIANGSSLADDSVSNGASLPEGIANGSLADDLVANGSSLADDTVANGTSPAEGVTEPILASASTISPQPSLETKSLLLSSQQSFDSVSTVVPAQPVPPRIPRVHDSSSMLSSISSSSSRLSESLLPFSNSEKRIVNGGFSQLFNNLGTYVPNFLNFRI